MSFQSSNRNRPSWSFTPGSNSSTTSQRRRSSSSHQSSATTAATQGNKNVDNSDLDESLCWFCQDERAAVSVKIPHPRFPKRDKIRRGYCLNHYYSTSVVRTVPLEDVQVVDQDELDRQLPHTQELFAEAFTQLQAQLTEEAARAFASQQNDPLALLHDLNESSSSTTRRNSNSSTKRGRKKPPPPPSNKDDGMDAQAGGFLHNVPLPERLLRTQQQQAQLQQEMVKRMDRAANQTAETTTASAVGDSHQKQNRKRPPPPAASATASVSQRRKSSRKSIWNVVLDEQETDKGVTHKKKPPPPSTIATVTEVELADGVTCTTCRNEAKVAILGSNTSRNQDLKKGETWGVKERDDGVMTRLQCQSCGKTWTEEL